MQLETSTGGETAAPQATGPWDRRYRVLTIGLILTILGPAFEALAVATTLPVTVDELGGLEFYGWAFSAFMLTNLVGITIAGGEADRRGPARPFMIGVLLFSLGLLIAGLAPTMGVLIAGRAVQGFGAGAIGSISYVAVGRGYPEQARARMLALLSSAWVVPGLIGPAIAGTIAEFAGWRWVFLCLVPITPLAGLMTLPALRNLAPSTTGARDLTRFWAALRLTIGAGLIMAGLGQSWLLLGGGMVLVGAVLALPSFGKLLPEGTLRLARGLPAAVAAGGVVNFVFFGVDAYVPLGLTAVRNQSAPTAGLALTAATLGWSGAAWLQANLVARYDRRLLAVGGLLLIGVGIVGVLLSLQPQPPPFIAIVAWGIAGIGMGFAYSTNTLVVLERATPGQEGAASAAMQLLNGLGIALGTGIGGVVVARASTVGSGIALQSILMLAAMLAGIAMSLRLPGRGSGAPAIEQPVAEEEELVSV